MSKIEIKICMGSSCFTRGNNVLIRAIQEWADEAKKQGSVQEIELSGTTCQDCCQEGPNLEVNGKRHGHMSEAVVRDVLKEGAE